jgi:hypothetical protein
MSAAPLPFHVFLTPRRESNQMTTPGKASPRKPPEKKQGEKIYINEEIR